MKVRVAADGAQGLCPYCGDQLAGQVGNCLVCKTPHHVECWKANGGCTTLGCPANPEPRGYNGSPRAGFVFQAVTNVRAAKARPLIDEQRVALEQARAQTAAIAALRAVLQSGDDAAIAQAAKVPDLRRDRLRASERLQSDRAIARMQALGGLVAAVGAGDDSAVVAAWWEAVLLGCDVSEPLTAAARAARRSRHVANRPSSPSPDTRLSSPEPHFYVSSAARYVRGVQEAQDSSVAELKAAIATGTDDEIVNAALAVRRAGARAQDVPWPVVYTAEQRASELADLKAALLAGDAERVARGWAKVAALWPGVIDPATDALGRAAFRRWGGMLRREKIAAGAGAGDEY